MQIEEIQKLNLWIYINLRMSSSSWNMSSYRIMSLNIILFCYVQQEKSFFTEAQYPSFKQVHLMKDRPISPKRN